MTHPASRYCIAIDLGRAAEYTALAVVEARPDGPAAERADPTADRAGDPEERPGQPTFAVVHLHRFPPGTAYQAVASYVARLLDKEPVDADVVLGISATGVKVLPLFGSRGDDRRPVPVVLTAGQREALGEMGTYLVPKLDVVTNLQMLLQARRLKVPSALPDTTTLVRELNNYRARPNLSSDPAVIDWREGSDDDLIFAVGLACWRLGTPAVGLDWAPEVGMRYEGWLTEGTNIRAQIRSRFDRFRRGT